MPVAALAGTSKREKETHAGEADGADDGHAEHLGQFEGESETPPKEVAMRVRMLTMMRPKATAEAHFAKR